MKILVIPQCVWGFFPVVDITMTCALARQAQVEEIVFLEPTRYATPTGRLPDHLVEWVDIPVPPNVRVIRRSSRLPRGPLVTLYESLQNIQFMRAYRPDGIYAINFLSASFLALYCRLMGKPIFAYYCTDDWTEMEIEWPIKLAIRRWTMPVTIGCAHFVLAHAHALVKKFSKYNRQIYWAPAGRVIRHEPEVPAESDSPPTGTRPRVVFAATLRNWYDFDIFFTLAKRFQEIDFFIYGGGVLLEPLRARAKAFPNVFVPGPVEPDKVGELVAKSLVGLLPLKMTKMMDAVLPDKILDYWLHKKAVICSPTYELQKVASGKALFADPNNPAEWIACFELLVNDEKQRQALGEKGHQTMLRDHNLEKLAARFIQLFQDANAC
jgi:glycosyltransferase involved in cell wall biosynthesis